MSVGDKIDAMIGGKLVATKVVAVINKTKLLVDYKGQEYVVRKDGNSWANSLL